MEIDLDWIQEELTAGREVELECVDRDGFLAGSCFENTEILRRDLIIESVFFGRVDIAGCDYSIVESEYKHFRIKQAPTFDDLIDVATQAAKDGLLEINKLNKDFITATLPYNHDFSFLTSYRSKPQNFKKNILSINSLYTETFVIESEDHIKMVKLKASVKLTNGNEFIVDNATNEFLTPSTSFEKLTILTLKGATVTQQKGNK